MAATKTKRTKAPAVVVTVSTFDHRRDRPVYRVVRSSKLADFTPIGSEEYAPLGNTPLLDATVDFIEDLRSRRNDKEVQVGLLLDESGSMSPNADAVIEAANRFVDGLREVKAVDPKTAGTGFLVIATDGYENASVRADYETMRRLVAECEDDGWVTVFLGASIDGWSQGRQMGLSGGYTGQTVSTVNTPRGTTSGMGMATKDAMSYLRSSTNYAQARATTGMRSVSEDGTETLSNIGATTPTPHPTLTPRPTRRPPRRPTSGYDPGDALRQVSARLRDDD